MDNNNESPELMSTNSGIAERGAQPIADFYANWEPDRSGSGYKVWFGRSYGETGPEIYNVRIGDELEHVRLPNRKSGTLRHEALPNEPKKLGKLSLTIDKEKTRLNYQD
ncbi:hypothetical protein [Herbaspirillum rhizosphaerae]|uniref:hypothetical protein n=1 Tax=Herbaspirillum rhizosphaerae TaxID=346179 RepID=UPI00067DD7FF|nr:hypothetical protein [Herbaspirillum rhizosphaerae]